LYIFAHVFNDKKREYLLKMSEKEKHTNQLLSSGFILNSFYFSYFFARKNIRE